MMVLRNTVDKYRNKPKAYICHAGIILLIAPILVHETFLGWFAVGQMQYSDTDKNTCSNNPVEITDYQDLINTYKILPHSSINEMVFNTKTYSYRHDNSKKFFYNDGDRVNDECVDCHIIDNKNSASCAQIFSQAKLNELPTIKLRQLDAYSRLLFMLTSLAISEGNIQIQNESLAIKIEEFICKNYLRKISINEICREMGVSRTTICNAVRYAFGQSIGDLVRHYRLLKATKLLQETDLPVSLIADAVSLENYNYFTKLFKRQMGISPSAYRKQCKRQAEC
jgi:AraC-like DNA-binding protein